MPDSENTQYRNLTALYGFKEDVPIDPRAPREWFEKNADVVLYPSRNGAVPWGYWIERGYAREWPVEIVLDTRSTLWRETAQEDVEETRADDQILGTMINPVVVDGTDRPAVALVTLEALYGFATPTAIDLALADPEWLDAHASGVIYSVKFDDLPVGHFLAEGFVFEIVTTRTLSSDDPRVAIAHKGVAVYEAITA